MLKKLLISVVVLLALIGGGVFYVGSNLDGLIKTAIEKIGSKVTKTDVKLDSVKIKLSDGKGTLSKLSIGNPEGFTMPRAFYLGDITVQIDPKSVASDGPIVINKIEIVKPQITYEVTTNGASNIQAIANNARNFAGSAKEEKAASAKKEEAKEPARKVIINDLYIRDGQISISHALLSGKAMSAQMPTIHLTNIGKDKGGASSAEIADVLLGIVSSSVAQAANLNIKNELSALKGKAIEGVSNKLIGIFGK